MPKQKPLKFHNFKELDKVLSRIEKDAGEKIIYSALNSGATKVKNKVKADVPVSEFHNKTFKRKGGGTHTVARGDLRESVKKGLRKKWDKKNKTSFSAYVGFGESWAHFVYNNHPTNAFGFSGGYAPRLARSVNNAQGEFVSIVGKKLSVKIAKRAQDKINKL
tara:strand:- start:328 stop:816 length:489 start_codon:yes stop_codon:yes gene_type:complete